MRLVDNRQNKKLINFFNFLKSHTTIFADDITVNIEVGRLTSVPDNLEKNDF
jgi:hypothetical protein